MYRLPIILLLLLAPALLKAQSNSGVLIRMGQSEKLHNIAAKGNTEKISAAKFKQDTQMYIVAPALPYALKSYEVSILLPTGTDLIGPFTVTADKQPGFMNKYTEWLNAGARVFYDKIELYCEKCPDNKSVAATNLVLTLE